MTREEQAYNKIIMLQNEIKESTVIMQEIYAEQQSLSRFYMDNIMCDARKQGREMRRLQSLCDKHRARISKNEKMIFKLKNKYGIFNV